MRVSGRQKFEKWLNYGLITFCLFALVEIWLITRDATALALFLIVLALAAVLFFAVAAFLISHIPAWLRGLRGITWADHLERLEKRGDAQREWYDTHRALVLQDLTTGCLVHFIEVGGGRLLCLYGQSYYEYEPIDDDPEFNRSRRFPTRTFSLLRHTKTGNVLAIFPGSDVVEPIVGEPIRSQSTFRDLGIELNDGEVMSDVPFQVVEQAGSRDP